MCKTDDGTKTVTRTQMSMPQTWKTSNNRKNRKPEHDKQDEQIKRKAETNERMKLSNLSQVQLEPSANKIDENHRLQPMERALVTRQRSNGQ